MDLNNRKMTNHPPSPEIVVGRLGWKLIERSVLQRLLLKLLTIIKKMQTNHMLQNNNVQCRYSTQRAGLQLLCSEEVRYHISQIHKSWLQTEKNDWRVSEGLPMESNCRREVRKNSRINASMEKRNLENILRVAVPCDKYIFFKLQ